MPSSVLSAPISSIGIPKEIKSDELRVAITPDGVKELVTQGLEVRVQSEAGKGVGISDNSFAEAGATIVDRDGAWSAHLVVKVKEPQEEEYKLLREDMVLLTYLHLAAYPKVGEALLKARTTSIGYETVQMEDGTLPLLAPMSEIAGRLAAQVGSHLLEKPHGGRGILIGGCTGVRPARVIVLGAGTVGWNAARLAAAMDAEVMLLDRSPERLRKLEAHRRGRLESIVSSRGLLERLIPSADLVIGAVLTPGDRAPTLVDKSMVTKMKPNSVIVDVSIDQGGCIATSIETTHTKPTINIEGIQHYAVSNMPGAVPFTSTEALVSVTLPYILCIAGRGLEGSLTERPEIVSGLNTIGGSICHPGVAKAIGAQPRHPMACLN